MISIELLNKLNINNEGILNKGVNISGYGEAYSSKFNEFNNLIEFCSKDNNKDSIDKLRRTASAFLPKFDDKYSGIYDNLCSEDLETRKKSFAFIKYIISNQIIIDMISSNYQVDQVGVKCFPEINKDKTIMLGEDYVTNIVFVANNTKNPIKVRIEGDKKEYTLDPYLLKVRYVRPSNSRGEKELKGELIYTKNGEETVFPFNQKYTVK